MVAAAALALSGCWGWSAPVPDGPATPEPVSTSPAPLDPEALERAATQLCGSTEPAPAPAFSAELTRPDSTLPNGMTLALGLRIVLESDHGEHSVRLDATQGSVVDGGGRVVGLVTELSIPGSATGSGPAVSMPVYLTIGSCPGQGAELGDPLPDGDYALLLFGPITPEDHDHAQAEHWVTQALPLSVADGEILPD